MLVNLLHALRTLRDHKKVNSTSIDLPKIDYAHPGTENRIRTWSNHVSPSTKKIEKIYTMALSKRSKGIKGESKGIELYFRN